MRSESAFFGLLSAFSTFLSSFIRKASQWHAIFPDHSGTRVALGDRHRTAFWLQLIYSGKSPPGDESLTTNQITKETATEIESMPPSTLVIGLGRSANV